MSGAALLIHAHAVRPITATGVRSHRIIVIVVP